jgi:hypothetical protein
VLYCTVDLHVCVVDFKSAFVLDMPLLSCVLREIRSYPNLNLFYSHGFILQVCVLFFLSGGCVMVEVQAVPNVQSYA